MNTQPASLQSSIIAATRAEPGKFLRVAMFVFLAVPGAWLVGTCGPLIVNVVANEPDFWFSCLLGFLFILGSGLLLYGTRTANEPLFLLVFVPMPVLIALGYHLGYLDHDAGFFVTVLGMVWPITYRPVSRYYKRRSAVSSRSVAPRALMSEFQD